MKWLALPLALVSAVIGKRPSCGAANLRFVF